MNNRMRSIVQCLVIILFLCFVRVAFAQAADVPPAVSPTDMRILGYAASVAVGTKLLLSMCKMLMPYFATDRGKAMIRILACAAGAAAGLAASLLGGLPLPQALIIAGGGPGAIAFHEIVTLIPVLEGKKKLPPPQPGDPDSVAVSTTVTSVVSTGTKTTDPAKDSTPPPTTT